MLTQQKGFLVVTFITCILLLACLIVSFTAFVFRIGFEKPTHNLGNSNNYDLLNSIQGHLYNSSWLTPGWSGKFSLGQIGNLLSDETKYFKSLKQLILENTYSLSSYNRSHNHYSNYSENIDPYSELEYDHKIMMNFGPHQVLVSKSTIRNE